MNLAEATAAAVLNADTDSAAIVSCVNLFQSLMADGKKLLLNTSEFPCGTRKRLSWSLVVDWFWSR